MNDNEYPRDPRAQPVLDLSDKSIRSSILKDLSRNFNADYQNKLLKGYDEPLLSKEKAEDAYKAGGLAELERAKRQEAESILAPSVFDEEWAKENDPEEYGRMQKAKSLDDAMNLALGVEGSTKYVNLGLPQMRKIANLMGKNPTERQLAEAAELSKVSSPFDASARRKQEGSLLDFVVKERLGIPHDTPGEQILEKVKNAHTELTGDADIPVIIRNLGKINPFIGEYGSLTSIGNRDKFAMVPKFISITDPKNTPAGVLEHEIGHALDEYKYIIPDYSPEILRQSIQDDLTRHYSKLIGKQDTSILEQKLLALDPTLDIDSVKLALEQMIPKESSILDLFGKKQKLKGENLIRYITNNNPEIQSMLDISKAGHHFIYPRNFEMQRSTELLNPSIPFSGPSLSENSRILQEVIGENPKNIKEAINLYRQKGFPNIENIIKENLRVNPNFRKQLE